MLVVMVHICVSVRSCVSIGVRSARVCDGMACNSLSVSFHTHLQHAQAVGSMAVPDFGFDSRARVSVRPFLDVFLFESLSLGRVPTDEI